MKGNSKAQEALSKADLTGSVTISKVLAIAVILQAIEVGQSLTERAFRNPELCEKR